MNKATEGILNDIDMSSGLTDRQRRTMVQMQRLRPLVRRQDYYSILGVSRTATQREIITAYRELARTVAPDKNPGMDTTEIFQAVNRAYEVLSDESKRREYDLGGQREEYDDDEDLGRGDETFSADLVNTLTAGVKPSESFRVLFEKELNRNVKWQAPSQSLENWIQTIVKNINSTVDTLISPHQSSVGSPDYLCPICAAIICKQKDPALLLLEEKHMKNNHNAYLARIESIRKSLKNPTSIEQVLYCDTIPFPVPVKSSLTLTSVQEGIAPPALLREIAKEFRSESNTSLLGNGWAGYAEWRQLLSFLEDISLRKGLLSLDLVESQLRTAMNDNLLPLGKKSEIPAAEYQVGTSVPILRKEGLHPSLQAVLDIPTVKTKRIPSSWQSSRSCSYCGSWVIFFSRSHCRVCGNTICSSCVRSRTLPSYGLTATRHTVCPTCYSQSYSSLWKSLAFESNAIRSVISGVIGISFLHPSDKRDLSQFSFTNSLDYLRVAFLCKQVPPITETEKSIVYRQREAWLRYATSSLNSAVRLYRSNSNSLLTPAAATHRKNIRVALTIARLLASVPSDRAEQCWDESRNSLMNSSEDGAYLLCLLMEKQGNWKDVGNIFLQQKLLLPALFCFKIHDENFNESGFFLQLAAKQTSPADVIFFTAAATLMDETASDVIQLATEAKKAGEVKWAVEILCAGWDKWKDSSKKARGHALLIECFEALNLPEISTVLMAGYELLCEIAEGARLQQYKTKLRDLQRQHVSSNSNEERGKDILRNLRYQLCLGSSELFAPLLLKAFQERDEEELEQIIAHQRRSFATADRSKLPAPVRSNLLLPEAVLDIIKGHYPEGVRKLMDALLLSISAGLDDYIKLATDILFEVEVRAGCLKVLSDEMKGIHTVEGLLRSSFLKDVEPAYSNVTNSDFQFARVLRNSAELRVMRMFERAIDGVEARDGSFEAAMSCLDAATICVGQSSRLKMLLKATHHFYRASIQKKNNKTNNTLAYNYACLFVGICIMHVASGIINKLSPVLQGYFLRQLLSQQILFLQKIYTLNNNKVPEDIEELLLTTTENTFKRLISIQGGFPTLWCRVQGRAFDDIISEMIYDKLSSAGIYKLELNLKGLITTEQWIYWRFEGVWNSWLNNPYNDVITAADEERRKIKEQQAMERKLREEEETAEEKVKEEKEETIYAKNRIRQMNQNAKKFFDEEREDAMIRYLNEKKWRWEDISKLINCMSVPRTVDGFIDPQKGLTPRNDFLFSSFDGFEVDRASGTVKFLLTESRRSGKPALFGWREIREIFNVGLPAMIFSLDAIDPQRQHHPFQLLHFNSEKARGTTVLSCMFHTDYILKFLSCGLEVSCLPPFKQRDVREGFLRRLPSYVQEDLSVIWSNQASNRSNDDQAHRFWIDAGDLAYSDTRDQNSYRVVYGKQMMRVKKHKLRLNGNGELVDDDGPDSLEDREYQFAANFTRHYDLIASYFPEFAMLGEFSKMISATVLLLCEAMNCKEIIKDITNNKTTVANQIESQLRNDLGSIDFPLAGSNKLNTMIEEHIQEQERIHHIRLTIQQRNQIRDEYQRQAREADNKQVNSLASSLGVSNSNSVRTMLITKNFTSIARELSESGAKDAMKKFETILSALRKEGLPVDGDITENMKQKMKGEWVTSPAVDFPCEWVPAVFRTGNYRGDMEEDDGPAGSYRVYGGVCLQAHLMKQVVNPPSMSQFFASPSTLSAQRAVSAPFSTAAKIDNQHRATQEFFQRQSQVLQQINAQRAANQRQQMINSFTNQQHSNATMNSGQVRRYMSHPQGAAGAYWTPDHFQSRSDARNRLAVLPEWNTMKYMAVSSIPRNTQVYSGSAAPQGAYSGGATQYVVPNRWSQREMADNARIYKHEWTPRFFETWNQVK